MSKELDKLIKQVLAEKRLPFSDEEIPNPNNDKWSKKYLEPYTGAVKATSKKNKNYWSVLRDIADNADDKDKIEPEDFVELFSKGKGPHQVRKDLTSKFGSGGRAAALALTTNINDGFKIWLNAKIKEASKESPFVKNAVQKASGASAIEQWKNKYYFQETGSTGGFENGVLKKALEKVQTEVFTAESDYWTEKRLKQAFATGPSNNNFALGLKVVKSSNQEVSQRARKELMTWLKDNPQGGLSWKDASPQIEDEIERMVGTRADVGEEDYFAPFGTDKTPDLSLEPELSPGERDQQEKVRNWKPAEDFLTTANSSLVSTFRAIEPAGKTRSVVNILGEVADFATAVSRGKDAIKKWIQSRPNGQMDYINFARVVAILADESRAAADTAAGGKFEQWLALLMNIPVVGAEQGSADNMGKLVSGQPIITSAKLYGSVCGSQAPSQSTSGFATQKGFENPGDKMYYFVGHKIKGEEQLPTISGVSRTFTSINFYLVELEKKKENVIFGSLLKQDGTKSPQYLCQNKIKTDDRGNVTGENPNQTLLFPCGPESGPMSESEIANYTYMKIPVWDKTLQQLFKDKRLVLTTADFLAEQVKGEDWASLTNAIIKSYKDIQRVEASTTRYYGSKQKGSGNASTYIDDVATKVQNMRDQLNRVFAMAGEDKQDPKTKKPKELVESKSPLDQLIEAIIKQKLLK